MTVILSHTHKNQIFHKNIKNIAFFYSQKFSNQHEVFHVERMDTMNKNFLVKMKYVILSVIKLTINLIILETSLDNYSTNFSIGKCVYLTKKGEKYFTIKFFVFSIKYKF